MTTLRSLLTLMLFCSLSAVADSSPADQQKGLQVIRSYNLLLNDGNERLLSALDLCLTARMKGQRAPNYLMKTKSLLGTEIDEEFTCKTLLSKYFGFEEEEPYLHRKSFRTMQYEAILAQSGTGSIEDTESLDGDFLQKFQSFEHPARGTLDLFTNQTVHMPKPEKIVWEKAFKDYQQLTLKNCLEFVTAEKKLILFRLGKFSGKPFTQHLCSVLTKKKTPELTWQEAWEVGIVRNSFTTFSKKKRKEWAKTHLEKYYEEISENPHFLLLESRVLTLPQMKSVVARMKLFQQKSSARLHEMKGSSLLSLVPYLDQAESTLSALMSNQNRWSPGHTEEVIGDLKAKHKSAESRKSYLQIGGLVGAMVACQVLPIGRARLFLRSACMFSLGLPLDIYFITDAALQRIRTVQDFTRTPEAEFFLMKPDAISEANKEVLYNLIFMPLDLPAGAALSATKKIIRKAKLPENL